MKKTLIYEIIVVLCNRIADYELREQHEKAKKLQRITNILFEMTKDDV